MKKTLIVLMMVLLCAMLITSCNGDAGSSSNKPTYTVTFQLGEGSGSGFDAQEVVEGEKAKKPATNPIATDKYKTFDFWSADGTTEFKFDETAITEDIELKAVYKDYEVGDTGPAGGKIFYVATTEQTSSYVDSNGTTQTYGWKCLEAAPEDITYTDGEGNVSNTFIFGLNWSMATGIAQKQLCGASENSDGNGDNAKIGKGKANTATLVQKLGDYAGNSESNYMSNTSVYAAKLCTSYEGGGSKDWFLPSLNELKELYNAYAAGKIGGTWHTVNTATLTGGQVDYYWSSSEYDENSAWAISFNNGWAGGSSRVGTGYDYVRPIRAF